ncbi:MAG TPA: VanW family protein [Syntrophomonadaceae bacterium]|nr:VanW family protein [Syntrophomonadaceae bacterium]
MKYRDGGKLGFVSEPKRRSSMRMRVGGIYFCWKRRLQSIFPRVLFAKLVPSVEQYPCPVAEHSTPLFRPISREHTWLLENKVVNLKLALSCLNGLVIRPGECFSFWHLVGKPTRRRGFLPGMVLCDGQVVAGIGGGLCQLSNLIYWMTLHTPLEVVERWRHNYDVFPDANRSQPFGSGATVSYNYIDLKIQNNTDQRFQLHLWLSDTLLCGEWRSMKPSFFTYEVFEKDHEIKLQAWGGYTRHNRLFRRILNESGQEIGEELLVENHAIMMYQPLLPGS